MKRNLQASKDQVYLADYFGVRNFNQIWTNKSIEQQSNQVSSIKKAKRKSSSFYEKNISSYTKKHFDISTVDFSTALMQRETNASLIDITKGRESPSFILSRMFFATPSDKTKRSTLPLRQERGVGPELEVKECTSEPTGFEALKRLRRSKMHKSLACITHIQDKEDIAASLLINDPPPKGIRIQKYRELQLGRAKSEFVKQLNEKRTKIVKKYQLLRRPNKRNLGKYLDSISTEQLRYCPDLPYRVLKIDGYTPGSFVEKIDIKNDNETAIQAIHTAQKLIAKAELRRDIFLRSMKGISSKMQEMSPFIEEMRSKQDRINGVRLGPFNSYSVVDIQGLKKFTPTIIN